MTYFKDNVARLYGIKAAIVAEHLWEITYENEDDSHFYRHDAIWARCSIKTMTVRFPFLTRSEIEYALNRLYTNGVIRKGKFNENRFDKTNWYSFTEYGELIMEDTTNET